MEKLRHKELQSNISEDPVETLTLRFIIDEEHNTIWIRTAALDKKYFTVRMLQESEYQRVEEIKDIPIRGNMEFTDFTRATILKMNNDLREEQVKFYEELRDPKNSDRLEQLIKILKNIGPTENKPDFGFIDPGYFTPVKDKIYG